MNISFSTSSTMAHLGLFNWIIILAVSVFLIVSLWKVFEKAGEPGWKCLIPWYNNYILFKIAMGNGWLFLLLFVPFVNFVALILVAVKLAKAFGGSTGLAIVMVLLPIVGYPMLAFGGYEYEEPQ